MYNNLYSIPEMYDTWDYYKNNPVGSIAEQKARLAKIASDIELEEFLQNTLIPNIERNPNYYSGIEVKNIDPIPVTPPPLSSGNDLATGLTNQPRKVVSSADEGFDVMRWLGKSANKAMPYGKLLGAAGVLADAGFGAYDAYTADPYQSQAAKTAEALGAGVGSGSGGWGGALLGAKLGGLATGPLAPVGILAGGLIGSVIGSKLGGMAGRGVGELAVGGLDFDDGRKENLKKERMENLQDRIDEMNLYTQAQQKIERDNAIFNQALAEDAMYKQGMMQMLMNASTNTGMANASNMVNAIWG